MDSQVYRDYTASIVSPARTTPKKAILQVLTSPDGDTTYNTIMPENSPKTCVEGDTGYIDLEDAYMPSSPTAQSTSSHVDELLNEPQTQPQADAEATFIRQAMPETPVVAGSKRNSNGEIVTSSSTNKKTPGFTQLFGGHERLQMLSATQLFNQTQAPSSPQLDGPRSDPVVTRPSPIVQNQLSVSSPTFTMTSPVRTTYSRPGTAGEPRGNYTTLDESQEWKNRFKDVLELQRQLDEDILDGGAGEDYDREQARYAQTRWRRELSEQAKQEWSKVRVSSRPSSRPTSRQNLSPQQPVTIDLVTPAPNKQVGMDFKNYDDEIYNLDDDVLMGEDEPHDVQASDDEYDELGQEVLRSQANNEEEDNQDEAVNEDAAINEHATMYAVGHSLTGSPEDDLVKAEVLAAQRLQTGSQHSAIADSQPNRTNNDRSLLSQRAMGPSSLPSIIPGSQLAPRSQNAVTHATIAATSSNEPTADALSNEQVKHVPSSPPIEIPRMDAETSAASDQSLFNARTVPESDLPGSDDRDDGDDGLWKRVNSNDDVRKDSNTFLYSTARTHASGSGQSPQKGNLSATPSKTSSSQQSKANSQTPRTAAGVRHFADITAAGSPPRGSGETDVDVDAIVSDVVTADDQDFMQMVSTPSEERLTKRRKISHTDTNEPSVMRMSDVSIGRKVRNEGRTRARNSSRMESSVDKTMNFEQPLRDRPSKGNELRASPPPPTLDSSTPESVKKREQAGATAASQLLSGRKAKTTRPSKQYGKNNRRTSTVRQPSSLNGTAPNSKDRIPSLETASHRDKTGIEEEEESGPLIEATREFDPDPLQQSNTVHEADVDLAASGMVDPVAANLHTPNRVFALFKGQPYYYYPATSLGADANGSTCRVKFDDGTITTIEFQHVCRLDLHMGDTVKVDLQGMRTNTWQVAGFGALGKDKTQLSSTDIHGRASVKIHAKSNRTSDASEHLTETHELSATTEVPISTLYLTRTMWPSFANRLLLPVATAEQATSRAGTPSSAGLAAPAEISVSRSGRTLIPTARAVSTRTSHLRDESVSAPESPAAQGQFCGMAFAISYGSNEGEKAEVMRLIRRNGGIILESGFDELFTLPNLDESAPTSPAKKSPRKAVKSDEGSVALQLRPEYSELNFVALIADRHSRRAKYVQALALGLPTLSGKWTSDSLDQSKNASQVPLSWSKYLLPAGESSYLGGAIRSRTLMYYDAAEARLSNTIGNRDILLNGDGVLIVVSKKGKSTWERRKPYAFLTLALGAAYVKRVFDLAEAKAVADNEPEKWKWVYVDGSVAEASAALFWKGSTAGKKRKRGEQAVKVDDKAMWATDGTLSVVNDEFVVQSLILGALVD